MKLLFGLFSLFLFYVLLLGMYPLTPNNNLALRICMSTSDIFSSGLITDIIMWTVILIFKCVWFSKLFTACHLIPANVCSPSAPFRGLVALMS
jgi:hypothetical protein